MSDTMTAQSLLQSLLSNLPPGLVGLRAELEAHFKARCQAIVAELNGVTRDEFEAQKKVLERTRQKLDELQAEWERLTSPKKPH